ncbi:GNAT family N-acetyltransferase [Iodobacter sp. HSC-16F04]|uniref:GNAT family N-acetyltransferase n=1 Tax=Iodobacter violaceini TaxID=3044271 RepID=A0ABX0KMJ9_9NEIS|nr:GNAT family N-acetyltransferase [Iodobacter violacea]NHQ84872.1 GNAT family N-acetyltransferase [Iodobacter violacea]
MKITLSKINPTSTILSDFLLDKIKNSKMRSDTIHYIAKLNLEELAFISLEIPENKTYLHLYEIIVEEKHRNKGHGTQIVKEILRLAKDHNRKEIYLTPRSLDPTVSTKILIYWYESFGFKKMTNSSEMFELKL